MKRSFSKMINKLDGVFNKIFSKKSTENTKIIYDITELKITGSVTYIDHNNQKKIKYLNTKSGEKNYRELCEMYCEIHAAMILNEPVNCFTKKPVHITGMTLLEHKGPFDMPFGRHVL